jgi:ABC-type antimicrobial peptide transport system permease subunit
MFENTNKTVAREIGKSTMRSHSLRNIMAVLAITLTTLLITTVFTVGVGLYEALRRGTEITPGPLSDGGVVAPLSAYEEIMALDEVDWAVYVRHCNIGTLHNRELIGIQTELLAPNADFYTRNNVEILTGHFPQRADEIAVSNTMAGRLGIGGSTRASYILKPVIFEAGKQVEKEIAVTITGIYTSPLEPLSGTYEEIYTAEAFLPEYAPEMERDAATFYVRLSESAKTQSSIGTLLDSINEQIGGNGIEYNVPMGFSLFEVSVIAAFIALIMICGYLLIYNVFYISIVNDIRFFGMLKTIGMTGKQIKALLSWQIVRLTVLGILLGIVLGYAVGMGIAPVVVSYTDYGDFYRMSANPLTFAGAAIFSVATVLLSCRKPYRMAMRISPVEAVRFSEKTGKRRKVLSVLSFALSGIIFLVAFTLTLGYDVEKMVERQNSADVRIRQYTMLYGSNESYQPVSQRVLDELAAIPFVKKVTTYYEARRVESAAQGSAEAEGQIKMTEAFRKVLDQSAKARMRLTENGDISLKVNGIPPEELHREEAHIMVLDGALDEAKFAAGGYVIYNQGSYQSGKLFESGIRAGDRLALSIYDLDLRKYVEKEAEVLAVVERVDPFPTGILSSATLSFSSNDFKSIYSLADSMIGYVQIDTEQELTAEQYQQIENTVQGSFNPQLRITSRYSDRIAYQTNKLSMTMIGLFLSGIFGVIGVCNILNTQVSGILSRKIEYATMQAVGMTKRQMARNILRGNLILCGFGVAIAIPISSFLAWQLSKIVLSLSGFSPPILAIGSVILLGVMFAVSISIAVGMTRFLNRKPVVERLREGE